MKRFKNKFKDVKISVRLFLGFMTVALIAAVIGMVGIIGMSQVSKADTALYNQRTKPLEYISTMIQSVQSMCVNERDSIVYSGDYEKLSTIKTNNKNNEQTFRDNQKKYLSALTDAKERSMINQAGKLFDQTFLPSMDEAIDYASKGNIDAAESVMIKGADSVNQMISIYDQCFTESNAAASSKSQSNTNLYYSLAVILILAILLGVIVSVLLNLRISKAINQPMEELVLVAGQFAEGKMDTRITYQSKNEIGQLADSFRNVFATLKQIIEEISSTLMKISQGDISTGRIQAYKGDFEPISNSVNIILDSLNQNFETIQRSSEEVGNGSMQVSNGAQALSQGVSEQAGIMDEISGSIMQVSQKTNNNTSHIAQVSTDIDNAVGQISKSNEKMGQMLFAMQDISTASGEIKKIIKVINNIAFQTNILALNAAVEAARAGEAGKGFSVVADEVRNLAQKSSDAAKQTAELIENCIRKVSDGSSIADSTASELGVVVENMGNIKETAHLIEDDSNDQVKSVAKMTQGIEQLSAVIQANSAAAEESAATSEELSSQASMLKQITARFRLRI